MRSLIPAVLATTLLSPITKDAVECHGNPNALGTSRTIIIDSAKYPRVGKLQYRQTLPLQDHEVVLTFDDGPVPSRTDRVLRILDHECVKATFFMVGQMATDYPAIARLVNAAGHTIGTHSQNHPRNLSKMLLAQAETEIDEGILSVTAALGRGFGPAPFFRAPGLSHDKAIDQYLESRHLVTWSTDIIADDWTKITPAEVYFRAIRRIEAEGGGILLLHDPQLKTVEALPALLQELKRRKYRIVHVVPAAGDHSDVARMLNPTKSALSFREDE